MARQVHKLQYTRGELDAILAKADGQPFVIWHDEAAGVYRFFPDEEKKNIWVQAYIDQELTPEIDAYQFAQPITAPAPYTINIVVINDNRYILDGTEGTTLDFTFETLDGNGSIIQESVDVYYTFRSPAGTLTATGVYNAGTEVHMNIDKYISIGKNTISIMVKGRATGTTKTVVAAYNVVKLDISSTFNIAAPIQPNTSFEATYTIEGEGDKTVEFYIDGVLVANPVVSSLEYLATKRQPIAGLASGKHTLQILAKMQIGSYQFRSKLLYYEFIVVGQEMTTTVISEEFPSTMAVYAGNTRPGLSGEQYVVKVINWAYYSSDPTMFNATIQWRLYTEGGVETPIATRNADIVEAENGIPPEPLRFMPTESGSYHLQALINNVVLEGGDYTISIIQNTAGILEATNGLTMKLSGLGRDNSEPDETRTSWENRGFSTTFTNQPWNNNSGWVDDALVLNGGATAQINNKPFAVEISPHTRNGCTFEIDFKTFNVNDEDAELVRIGGLGTASLVITSNKAILRSRDGNTLLWRFKSDERIKLAFVVYPNSTSDYPRKAFIYSNGVMSQVINYDVADNFNIGSLEDTESQIGMINLGNAAGEAGIKIYYMRTYDNYINMYEESNNYFIDSGENINYLVNDNDIYAQGTHIIDVDKLEGTITTVKITGSLGEIIGTGSKDNKLTCGLEVVSPFNSSINLYCDKAQVNKAGQSTLDKPVPSFHVRLDKIAGNICYDRDGKVYPKNRWAFRQGNVPEKKFRLQANYMDSSGCHNGAFFRMINEVYPKVKINGQDVLRMPSEKYATDTYPTAMQNIYGDDPSGNDWKFPYTLNIVPDSIPCIVVWRPDDNSAYRFLGQYVIMEEKKANYANGMHSIYSGLDSKGNPDPFGFNSSKTGTKLWDNAGCHQMEFLRSSEYLELFLSEDAWDTRREDAFELVYPDEDDLTPTEIDAEWDKFYNDIVHPIVSSKNNQQAFDALLYGSNPKLDRWGFAAYYCLAMRNACSDSLVRNMELVTYDGNIWTPKWWDVDMQCGLQQSGECNIQPTSTRDTQISPNVYAFSGKIVVDGQLRSSWLWDGLEGSVQFQKDVQAMDAALYQAGWRYTAMTQIQDQEYIEAWSNALYNESGIVKYLTYDELNYKSLQGDRTSHRHWFLRSSYDYFDALNVCGEYTSKRFEARTISIAPDKYIYITAAATSYFGWEHTNDIVESGIRIEKGETGHLTINQTLHYQDPLHIFGANKISELDMHEISQNFYADIDFSSTTDEVLGSQLKKIIIGTGDGTTKTRLNNGEFNTQISANVIGGVDTLDKLEYLDVQGMNTLRNIDMTNMKSLKKFYAAGSILAAFNPGDGSNLTEIELPTTIMSMTMNGCNLTDGNGHCVIKWYETNYTSDVPTSVTLTTVPATLRTLIFTGMGNDNGTKELIFDWVNAVYDEYGDEGLYNLQVTCRNVNWDNVDVDDLLLLSKIPTSARSITGYIKCAGNLTGEDIVNLQEAFGTGVFTNNPGVPLRIDAAGGFVLAAPSEILAGTTYAVSGISFPIAEGGSSVKYSLGTFDENDVFVPLSPLTSPDGRYYQYMATINGVDTVVATLQENTGEFVAIENAYSALSYELGIRGQTLYSQDVAHVTINKRVYPTSIDFNVQHTSGVITYDDVNDAYYVTSDDLTINVLVETDPEEITGTIVSDVWTISPSISNAFGGIEDTNSFTFYVEHAGSEILTGTISHTKTYVGGYSVTVGITLRFKSPTIALTSLVNQVLQAAIYAGGYSEAELFAYDNELWPITDLNTLGIFNSGSQLEHLAEIKDFINLNMTTLDLSNCTQFGVNSYQKELEDGSVDYVNVLPSANRTLPFDFEEIDMRNTHLAGVNLKQGNVLETISYSDYTEDIILINQSTLAEVNLPLASIDTLDSIIIENCNKLEEITWI